MPAEFRSAILAVPILAADFRPRGRRSGESIWSSPYGVGPPRAMSNVAVVYSKPTVTDLVTDLLWPVRLNLLVIRMSPRATRAESVRIHRVQ